MTNAVNDQWYWKHKGTTLGPLSTEDLAEIVRRHRLSPLDEVRLADNSDWMSAAEIKALFAESDANSAVDAATQLLSRSKRIRPGESEVRPLTVNVGGAVQFLRQILVSVVEFLVDWFLVGVEKLKPLFNRWVIGAVATVLLISFLFRSFDLSNTQNRQVFSNLNTTLQQIQVLESTQGSEQEWKEFQSATLAWMEPALLDLTNTSKRISWSGLRFLGWESGNQETRRLLIQTLQRAITLVRSLPNVTQSQLDGVAKNMSVIDYRFSGKMLEGASPGQGLAQAAASGSNSSDNTLMIGIVILDVVLVGGGLFYWLSRRTQSA